MASQKKVFYVERTEFCLRIARLSGNGDGSALEEVREISSQAPEEVKSFVQEIAQVKAGQMIRANCGIYPEKRVLRHIPLKEEGAVTDPRQLEELITGQIKINPNDYSLAALNGQDGSLFQPGRAHRDLVVCGAPKGELKEAQDFLVACGIYPERLELGSVATIGLFIQQMKALAMETPLLLLELASDSSHVVILNKGKVDAARPISMGLNSMIAGVRDELGLKDEAAARRLFFSDSFDFREMGPRLIERLLRELQSMIGFYEVQTGQSISRMVCTLLPAKLGWLNDTFASALGMQKIDTNFNKVLSGARLAGVFDVPVGQDAPYGLFGLMINQGVVK